MDGRKKGKEKALELASEEVKTKKETGKPFCHIQRKEREPLRGISVASTSKYISKADEAGFSLQRRTQSSTSLKKARVNEVTNPGKITIDGRSFPKKVKWADAAGLALTREAIPQSEDSDPASNTRLIDTPSTRIWRRSDTIHEKPPTSFSSGSKKSYKEALLTPCSVTPSRLNRRKPIFNSSHLPTSPGSVSFKGRCYRCLDTDHRAAFCKAPIRCLRCRKTGHIARACMDRLPMSVYRAMRARPSYLSAFVPLSEDFFARQNRRRNAMLVDVLPPRTLGHFPQETIANKLASRFGGLPADFHVARYSERDFVIFLPEWVPSDQLIRREILSLDNLRLRCYPWNPYERARRAQLTYNVWIRLVSLPYECWSSRTVAALVGGFGRFIRADDFSVRMVDLTGYRCLVSVDYLSDIPENLEITVGDSSLSVLIQLERWGRRDAVAPGNPPNDQTDQHDPLQRPPVAPRRSEGSIRGRRSSAGGSSTSDASWNSSEIRDRRRAAYVPDGSSLDAPVAPLRRFVEEEHSSSPVSVERLSPPMIVESLSPPVIAGSCGQTVLVSKCSDADVASTVHSPASPDKRVLSGEACRGRSSKSPAVRRRSQSRHRAVDIPPPMYHT
uniref:CCHC-type domain-containing protein n=1 Tax=Ananas comosus var. bracteatus TaxID=296719 RepID=A0A6V7QI08_ANACO|nr:unnamed protein product [Ananas comosus var. bracteatus]